MLEILSITEDEKNETVLGLLEHIKVRDERIAALETELARLKKLPKKPKLKASNIGKKDKSISKKKSAKGKKLQKSKELKIHKTITLTPLDLPPDAKLHSSHEYVIQDIKINLINTKYIREIYKTSDGKYLYASLPKHLKGHYGSEVRRYILYQHYALHIPQNAILKQLQAIGLLISAGTVNDILTKGNNLFHEEKKSLLKAGIENSSYITVDDTGMPHKGKKTYCINGYAIDYLKLSKFPQEKITLFERTQGKKFSKIPESDSQVKEQKKIISQIWKFYKLLKFYKEFPCYRNKVRLENIFDRIFCQKVQWNALTERLKLIHKNKKGLLLVLGRPEIPFSV